MAIATTASVANNRLASVNAVSYSYDASGNLTNDGTHTYQYDGQGRQVSVDSGAAATSVYDANNWRVKKVAGGVTVHCVWAGSQVIAEYNASTGGLIAEYVYAGSRMVAREQGGLLRYYHQDRLSTRLISDASGAVMGTEDHLPFGEEAGVVGESEKHRFTTYERDSESNTDQAINRQHQFTTGRFMQADPMQGSLSNPQSLNRYTYALDDPINLNDPLGLYEGCVHQAMTEYLIRQSGLGKDSRLASEIGYFAGDGPGGADSFEFAATNPKNMLPGGTAYTIHFAGEARLELYKNILDVAINVGNFQRAGHMLHAIEDAHGAHLGYHASIGHFFDGHAPDRVIGDSTFVNVANEVYDVLTNDRSAKLTPKQLNELLNAVLNQCGDKAKQLTVTRPRRVGGGSGESGGGFGQFLWWLNTVNSFLDWIHSIQTGGPEADHYA
jgi:RHS repeat-associated protein